MKTLMILAVLFATTAHAKFGDLDEYHEQVEQQMQQNNARDEARLQRQMDDAINSIGEGSKQITRDAEAQQRYRHERAYQTGVLFDLNERMLK